MQTKKLNIILIIIIILLIGIIGNFIKKDFFNNYKIILKAMTETEYENSITSLNKSHEDYAKHIEESKKKIASAITEKGVQTSNDETLEIMANKIKSIETFNSIDLSNAEIAYVHFIRGATYMSSVQVNNGTTRNDSTMRTVDMTKMKAELCYFKYGEQYDGITCQYTSSGFTVKKDGKFYVYSTCPGYERNEIIDCKAGDIIAMVVPITTSDTITEHINLVIAL